MCLAIPARITAIDPTGQSATVALGAVTRDCSLALIEDAAVGDYVLMHVGYALNRISPEEAQQTLALMREAGVLVDQDGLAPALADTAGPA
ncbi:HypC/HybG/HupF family hydrogenase formation chaperone [uncultured Thiodictyon sp.]|jgi:hydrogenase expression/formation protein HypC|uniref:HypC/HybG/HupF family hydrogenase formation chaperone n=1 Tax=uncultured Thiodictyon sp. TaxID=1846217 RepID=UPI0025FA3B66|nr:HypC/HybG/HupF family hydrogenase formation chaperone [uncultured Thiodictyon sp.]